MSRLEGRKILVVGAGTRPTDDPDAPAGNGRAIAVTAATEGATVACADLDVVAARETATLVRDAGGHAQVIVADVSDPDACTAMVAEAADLLDGLDGVVVNVGIGAGRWLGTTSVDEWDHVFDVNVRAHFLTCRAALPLLSDGGSIVLISSVAGLRPGSTIPAYDASKAALAGLCRHVAFEGSRRGIRANVVAPGLIDRRRDNRALQWTLQAEKPLSPRQTLVLEWRARSVRDPIPLYQYKAQSLGAFIQQQF